MKVSKSEISTRVVKESANKSPTPPQELIRLRAGDELIKFSRTGQWDDALLCALEPLRDDPDDEVRDALNVVFADLRLSAPDGYRETLSGLLAKAEYVRLSPGNVMRKLDGLIARTRAESEECEGLLRIAIASRRLLCQTTPVLKQTLDIIIGGVGRIESDALAACDILGTGSGVNDGPLAKSLLRGPSSNCRPEWKAACDYSLIALEVFKNLEKKLPPNSGWWKSRPAILGMFGTVLFLVGLMLGVSIFKSPTQAMETVSQPLPAPAIDSTEISAPSPLPIADLRRVVVIAPESLSFSPLALEVMARCEQLVHNSGPSEKNKPAPPVEVVPYGTLPAAAFISPDYLTSSAVEPVLSRMKHLGMLGGADHAIVMRPLRKDTIAVTVIRLESPIQPAAEQANETLPIVPNEVSVRIWSDVWVLSGLGVDLLGKERRAIRIGLAWTENIDHGRLAAEVLWRQADATADDYAIAAAYYLTSAEANSQEFARGREILWAGYSRFKSDVLAKLLLATENLHTRLALAKAHPAVLNGPDRHGFVEPNVDESQAAARHDLLQTWSKSLINEVFDAN